MCRYGVEKSIDTVLEKEQIIVNYPVEFLNSLELPEIPLELPEIPFELPEIPSHKLTLKIGSPILLLPGI